MRSTRAAEPPDPWHYEARGQHSGFWGYVLLLYVCKLPYGEVCNCELLTHLLVGGASLSPLGLLRLSATGARSVFGLSLSLSHVSVCAVGKQL